MFKSINITRHSWFYYISQLSNPVLVFFQSFSDSIIQFQPILIMISLLYCYGVQIFMQTTLSALRSEIAQLITIKTKS